MKIDELKKQLEGIRETIGTDPDQSRFTGNAMSGINMTLDNLSAEAARREADATAKAEREAVNLAAARKVVAEADAAAKVASATATSPKVTPAAAPAKATS